MQEIGIYAIYDRKGMRYDTPNFMANDLHAKRFFHIIILEKKGAIFHFKDDFEMHKIGKMDVITGQIERDYKVVIEGKQIAKENVQ